MWFVSKKTNLSEQCRIPKIILTIADNLPKGKEKGKDNRILNYTINNADLQKENKKQNK